jgi:hypothetical protein
VVLHRDLTLEGHITDDGLMRLMLDTLKDDDDLATVEEHLLVCAECIARAESTRRYTAAMLGVLAKPKGS